MKLYEVLDDHTNDKLYLVLEWAEKGQAMKMETADKPSEILPYEKTWKYFRHLVSGLNYCMFLIFTIIFQKYFCFIFYLYIL